MKAGKWLSLILAVAMVVSLAACGGGGNTTPSTGATGGQESQAPATQAPATQAPSTQAPQSEAPSTEPAPPEDTLSGTITVSFIARSGMEEALKRVAEGYEKLHPNVDVVIDLKADEGYYEWVTTVANSENPDVDIAEFYHGDVWSLDLMDFSDYIDLDSPYTDGTWGEQFNPAGQLYSAATQKMDRLAFFSTQVIWMYNKDIFEEVGVEVPQTWDELIDICEKIQAAGYQPVALGGDYDSINMTHVAWLSRIYNDQVTRSLVKTWHAQEGDFCYDPDIDADWEYDPTDPYNDTEDHMSYNILRVMNSILDGTWRFDSPGQKTVWTNFLRLFPKYCGGDAMFGLSTGGATTLFNQGKAAMTVNLSGAVAEFDRMMKEVEEYGFFTNADGEEVEGSVFHLGTFNMPSMEGEGVEAKARTIAGYVLDFSALNKDQDHNELVVDFLMYFSSPEGMSLYLDGLMDGGGSVDGPTYVYNVEYPEELAGKFDDIEDIGGAQHGYAYAFASGVPYIDESMREFYNDVYALLSESIDVDEFLKRYEDNILTYAPALCGALNISEKDLENPAAAPAGN